MRGLSAISVVALIHCSYAVLVLKGPSQPVLQGDTATLECLVSDPELNTSQVHFEFLSERVQTWCRVTPYEDRYLRRICFNPYPYERRVDGRLLLDIPSYYSATRSYRCVSDANSTTAAQQISEPLTIKVHYMQDPVLYRRGGGISGFAGATQDLKVPLGDDVAVDCSAGSSEKPSYFWQKEGDDWILPSSKLMLKKVQLLDGGQYTCSVQHPLVKSLTKSRTISITVLPEDAPWYESSIGRLVLMTGGAAVAALLVLILTVGVFLCRRASQATSSKGPIDDRSQKKPIYRGSVESLTSATAAGDEQPLV